MTAPDIDPKDLRVSDDERSHVLKVLEKATGRGLIDLGEYNVRSSIVIAARTRGELNRVLQDLPGLQVGGMPLDQATRAASGAAPWSTPQPNRDVSDGWLPDTGQLESGTGRPAGQGDVLNLTGWGTRTFKGNWVAPAKVVVAGWGATTKLDFTKAQLTSSTITIEFQSNYGGTADLVVPVGTNVRYDGLEMRGGNVVNKVAPSSAPPVLNLVLTGVKRQGTITIRAPRGKLLSELFS